MAGPGQEASLRAKVQSRCCAVSKDSESPMLGPVSLGNTSHPLDTHVPRPFLPLARALRPSELVCCKAGLCFPLLVDTQVQGPVGASVGPHLPAGFTFLARRALVETWPCIAIPAPKGWEDWMSSCLQITQRRAPQLVASLWDVWFMTYDSSAPCQRLPPQGLVIGSH